MSIKEIKQSLDHGDQRRIAKIAKASKIYVHMVLTGKRRPNSAKAKQILRAAQIIARQNKNLDIELETDEAA